MARKPEMLECPNCAAALEQGTARTPLVRCQYCGAQIRVRPDDPPKPRPVPPPVVNQAAPRPRLPTPKPTPVAKTSARLVVLAIGIPLLLAIGLSVAAWRVRRHATESAPGELHAASVSRPKGGAPTVLLASGRFHLENGAHYRIDAVDAKTGRHLARARFEWEGGTMMDQKAQRPQMQPAGPGRMWTIVQGKLHLRDPRTLAVIASYDRLKALNPALAEGIAFSKYFNRWSVQVDGWSGAAVVANKLGGRISIDAKTLRSRRYVRAKEEVALETSAGRVNRAAVEGALDLGGRLRQGRDSLSIYRERRLSAKQRQILAGLPRLRALGHRERYLSGRPIETAQGRFTLERVDDSLRFDLTVQRPGERAAPRGPALGTFVKPAFLATIDDPSRPLELPDGSGFVVVHHEGTTGRLRADRVTLAGKSAWSMALAAPAIVLAVRVDDLLILALEGLGLAAPWRVLAIQWRDGKLRWKYEH